MRIRMPVIAAGALAAALAFGSAARTSADPLPQLNAFEVADTTPTVVTLLADAPASLNGEFAAVLFGAQPFEGGTVAGATLVTGANLITAPNMGPGWFTAVGNFQAITTGQGSMEEALGEY